MTDMPLSGFIAHVAKVGIEIGLAVEEALKEAAELVEREAKAEIGIYQAAAPPFAAWPELADATKDDRVRQGFSENDPGLRTGEMRDSIGHAIGWMEAVVGSNDDKLVYFELGTDKQPPRSVLGTAAVRKGQEVAEIFGSEVHKALIGDGVHKGRLPIP